LNSLPVSSLKGFLMAGLFAAIRPFRPGADDRLAQTVATAVRARGRREGVQLTVVADEGTVTLQGLARSFYDKQLLLHAVQHVPGVREIVDEVDVMPITAR
jgi:osmotically-inducible protein OsmY